MVTFKIKSRDCRKISNSLDRRAWRVRFVPEANLGAIRVSFHVYNNEQEVKGLLKEIKKEAD
jgi:selenocysteine lyase/cysteine desulfurase